MAKWKRYTDILINRYITEYILICLINREKYSDIRYIGKSISTDYFTQINTYLLDGLSKLTRITTYFQTCKHEKLITTFFTRYFPSPSVCHKNITFCWKLLQTVIFSLELEILIIPFFRERKIYQYTPIYCTPIYIHRVIHLKCPTPQNLKNKNS